jgi:hypothetical protein
LIAHRGSRAAVAWGLLLLLCLAWTVPMHAVEPWPLTSNSGPQGLSLETVIPIRATSEQGSTSGLEGAPQAPEDPLGPVASVKVRDTGPDQNRLVLVTMGDGFTQADLAKGAYSAQVSRFLKYFFSASPWSAYSNVVNVYQVDVVSRESGADYQDASPAAGGTLKDTYLDARFWAGGVERALALTGKGILRAFAAADSELGARTWDEVVVFVNSTKYGGNGGAVTVSSLHPAADEIQVHELGHSLADLADEYETGLSGTNCIGSPLPNLDCGLQFPRVKWDVWVEPGTPIPTPETPQYAGVVGAFEGGYYQKAGVYRPMLDCKMRTLGVPFCVVCREALVLKLFQRISLLDAVSPPPGPIDLLTTTPQTFEVTALPLPGLTYRWWLNGAELTGEGTSSVTISSADLTGPSTELRLVVTHSTPLVRSQPIQTNLVWHLNAVAAPALAVSEVTLAHLEAGISQALLTATLSFPSARIITVDYASADGTAVAGAAYVPVSGRLVFAPGQTNQTLMVQVIGEFVPEPSKKGFYIEFSNPQNAVLSTRQVLVTLPSFSLLAPTLNLQTGIWSDPSYLVRFDGIPGKTYGIESTESLSQPVWQSLGRATADPLGSFEFTDTPPPGVRQRYYRSVDR